MEDINNSIDSHDSVTTVATIPFQCNIESKKVNNRKTIIGSHEGETSADDEPSEAAEEH
jgi:hypothetical protein